MNRPDGTSRPRLFLPWLAVAVICIAWMWLQPGKEVIPFHLVWICFALAYGFEAWALRPTAVALAVVTAATGAIVLQRSVTGTIAWEETSEIPLMLLLAVLVVWHVQRREAALATVTLLADREAASAARRVRLARLTSHEMRTPLTIASGYLQLILARPVEPEVREELEVAHDELGRLARASDRLLRTIQLADPLERSPVDVDALLQETAHRWSAVAARDWVVESSGGVLDASAERLRACLDTLIENAVRYTAQGDTVQLYAARTGSELWLAVADSGPGLDADLMTAINERQPHAAHLERQVGSHTSSSQTGLGIALVQEIVEARAGRVVVGRSHYGGAVVVLILPTGPPDPFALADASHASTLHPPWIDQIDPDTWAQLSPDAPPVTAGSLRGPAAEEGWAC